MRVDSRGSRAPACLLMRVRVCLCVCVCVCVSVCVCARARLLIWLCARSCTACLNERRVRAPRRCARPPIAPRRLAVFIARPAPRVAAARAVAFGATGRLSRAFGRRCHVDVPHGQRAMGWPIFAHVGGRRRLRRHLRPRRLRRHHQQQRRMGEHRRRCAGRTRSRGWVGGYSRGT